jgi:hypothetical protein
VIMFYYRSTACQITQCRLRSHRLEFLPVISGLDPPSDSDRGSLPRCSVELGRPSRCVTKSGHLYGGFDHCYLFSASKSSLPDLSPELVFVGHKGENDCLAQ